MQANHAVFLLSNLRQQPSDQKSVEQGTIRRFEKVILKIRLIDYAYL